MKKIFLLILPFLLFAEIIKYNNLQKNYFSNQIVNLKGKIILQKDINITAIPTKNVEINLTKTNPYIYKFEIRFQATPDEHKIVLIGQKFYKEINLNNIIHIKPITTPENFCGVYADKLNIFNPISSKYDKNKNIISFTIKCKNCNIKNFKIDGYDQNLTILSDGEASFYVLLPKNIKKIHFYYYDLNHSKFNKITIPLVLKQETISTQTNINPEGSKIFTPINILLLVIVAFFLIIFLVYQKIWILIFPFLIIAYLVYSFLPKGSIELPKNTKVQILPTPQSTVIYVTQRPTQVEILMKRDGYIKVKIDNKTGWVKK